MENNLIDLKPNLRIFRIKQGVKLVSSDSTIQQSEDEFDTGYTVGSLNELPFNFYFLNLAGETLLMNQQCVELCGFRSAEDSKGKSLHAVSEAESASQLIENCNQAIIENKIKIFEEKNIRKDGVALQFLSIKAPWYNEDNQCIGVFGCSIVLGRQSLSESLEKITELGLLTSNVDFSNKVIPPINETKEKLSERESLCLRYLCQGHTLKSIAKLIDLSPKTIETYLDRAKLKLNCKNKAELIAVYLAKYS